MYRNKIVMTFILSCWMAFPFPSEAQFITSLNKVTEKQGVSGSKQIKLIQLLADLEIEYNVHFNYDNDLLSSIIVDYKTLDSEHNNIEETLTNLLRAHGLAFEKISPSYYVIIRDKLLRNPEPVPLPADTTPDPQLVITGRVMSGEGDPLPGVSVLLQRSAIGTSTGADGTFSLKIPDPDGILRFSFLGFISQEIPVPLSGVIEVTLKEDISALNEVVVTGYSVEQKKDIIGSVSVLEMDNVLSIPSGNLKTQLQGNAAGVTVSSNGNPGSGGKVRIRGFGSFGGSDPLYIIDGVPGGVDNLNANDVASIQILKDAASASIYGARAANGVIIVTTKKGKPGKAKLSVNSYYGVNYVSPADFPDVLNAQENGELYWKAMAGAGRKVGDPDWGHPQYGDGAAPVIPEYILVVNNGARIGGAELGALKGGTDAQQALFASLVDPANYDFATHQIVRSANTDWADEVFNPATIQSHQVSLSGGSEFGTYALGLNYFNEGNIASEYNKFDRYSIRVNTVFNIAESIRVGENLQAVYRQNKSPDTWASTVMTMHPLVPVWDEFGNPAGNAAPSTGGEPQFSTNPVTQAWRNRFDSSDRFGILGNVYAEADLLESLSIRTSIGTDYSNSRSLNLTQVTYEHAQNTNPPNSLSESRSQGNTWTWTNTLNYRQSWNRHAFKALLGSESINSRSNNLSGRRNDFDIDDDPDFLVIDAGTGPQTNSGSFGRNSLFSLFGRLDYTFDDKYFINATVRRDQSSKFGKNFRTGYFPSGAIGWRISSENFMEEIEWISDLKLRASWGVIGNQNGLNNNNQYDVYVTSDGNSYSMSGENTSRVVSLTPSRIGNPSTRWEKSSTTNIGFDASLFATSLDINFDWYTRRTSDLLATNQAPYTGPSITQPAINVGELMNRGIDLGITKQGQVHALNYSATIIFSRYKNEVLRVLDNPLATLNGGRTRMGNATITQAGYPISSFYGYLIDGFFNTEEEAAAYDADYSTWLTPAIGRWRIKDINGDHKIDGSDRTIMGSPHPDFQTSFNLSLSYKNFDFTCFVFWSKGGSAFNYTRYVVDFHTFTTSRSKRMLYESWTPELGDDAKLPKLDLNDSYSSSNITDYFLEDASYLRLKTIQVGYTLPANLSNKLRLDRLRFYIQGQNLLTHSNSTLLDPGVAQSIGGDTSMGVVNNYVPTPKQLICGLSIGL